MYNSKLICDISQSIDVKMRSMSYIILIAIIINILFLYHDVKYIISNVAWIVNYSIYNNG